VPAGRHRRSGNRGDQRPDQRADRRLEAWHIVRTIADIAAMCAAFLALLAA